MHRINSDRKPEDLNFLAERHISVRGLSKRLGPQHPTDVKIILRTFKFYHSSITLLNEVVPHRSGARNIGSTANKIEGTPP
jgi:hypothetical protein